MPEAEETNLYRHLGMPETDDAVRSQARTNYEEALQQVLDGAITDQVEYELASMGGKKTWGTETDLDENAYGAAAVAIVKDATKLFQQMQDKVPLKAVALTLSRLGFSLGLMAVNLLFQLLILRYIYNFVVQPSVRHVQVLYADFHYHNFDEQGNLDKEAWEDYPGKEHVCQVTMSSKKFYYGILTLWALLMMTELRSCHRVIMDIWGIRSVRTMSEALDFVHTKSYELGGRCLIVGLTPTTRAALLFFICIPRSIIGVALFVLGCQWLSSSASFTDMTLNAMALDFVKNIDEILYDSVLPRRLKNDIAETNLFKVENQKTLGDVNRAEWAGYKRTVAWVALMAGFLWVYSTLLQTVLPFDLSELHSLCAEEMAKRQTPLCGHWTWNGWSESCYPYGALAEG